MCSWMEYSFGENAQPGLLRGRNMTDEEFTLPVDPNDLKSAWAVFEEAKKHLPDRDPNQGEDVQKVIHIDCKQACSPGANIETIRYRLMWLGLLQAMSKSGSLMLWLQQKALASTLPELLADDKPSDAVFKAFATVRMINSRQLVSVQQLGVERKEFPVDLEELTQLIGESKA
jgi:hypothetical protein